MVDKSFSFLLLSLLTSLLLVPTARAQSTDPDLKVAFIGDNGNGAPARSVLTLIKNEGADAVIHQGDLEYLNSPSAWEQQINSILPADFPYFASVGNHDDNFWSGYQDVMVPRVGSYCTGDFGIRSHCKFKGLSFILSGVGTVAGSADAAYITSEFANDTSIWKACSWHKVMQSMQLGTKTSDTGWEVYEACREAGAFVATGHEHSYARSYTMTKFETHEIDSSCNSPTSLCLTRGTSFAFVNGLGGKSPDSNTRCPAGNTSAECKKWAGKYSRSDSADPYGALFITFNFQGDPNRAHAEFKVASNGQTIDSFDITAGGPSGGSNASGPTGPTGSSTNDSGASGATGATGPTGDSAADSGASGPTGATGDSGASGAIGPTGDSSGNSGASSASGPSGGSGSAPAGNSGGGGSGPAGNTQTGGGGSGGGGGQISGQLGKAQSLKNRLDNIWSRLKKRIQKGKNRNQLSSVVKNVDQAQKQVERAYTRAQSGGNRTGRMKKLTQTLASYKQAIKAAIKAAR